MHTATMHCLMVLLLSFQLGKALEIANDVSHYKGLTRRINENNQQPSLEQLITDMLYDGVRSTKCFALICDPMYCDLFTGKMFRKFKVHTSYFMIQVAEGEDLLSPYNDTQHTLNRIKVEGCQYYIILVANGIQVSRFLRFGDRYRVLDTRSNFILLYDTRLFHANLHYIWSRIVNAVFIRQYGGRRASNRAVSTPWFELSTVPFPTPIRSVLIPRRLDSWRTGHFRLGVNLFRDKTTDLQNQTLKVVTFQHVPATVKTLVAVEDMDNATGTSDPVIYSGLEVEILRTLAAQMNFEPYIYEASNADLEQWGHKRDGQFSGLLGEMVTFRAELALGDLYYSPYHLDLMDLSVPYNTECLTFLTPESTTNNAWLTLVLPFKLYMWLTVIFVVFLLGGIFLLLARFHRHLYDATAAPDAGNKRFHIYAAEDPPTGLYLFADPCNSLLYTYSMLLLVSLPKVPDGWSLRTIVGWYFLYCTLVVVSYKASMTAILTNPAPKITIDNLQELEASELACGGWGEAVRDFFQTSLDSAGQKIGARFELVNDTDSAVERVASGTFAYYENVHYLRAAAVRRQVRIEGERENDSAAARRDNENLHIMSRCVINMPISLGLQKNSPIKQRVDVFIRRVIEGGFVQKWLGDVMQATLNNEISPDTDESTALMNLGKLYCGFVALFLGYLVSCVAVAVEVAHWRLVVMRHPHFDKYSKQILHIPVKQ